MVLMWEFRKVAEKIMRPCHCKKYNYFFWEIFFLEFDPAFQRNGPAQIPACTEVALIETKPVYHSWTSQSVCITEWFKMLGSQDCTFLSVWMCRTHHEFYTQGKRVRLFTMMWQNVSLSHLLWLCQVVLPWFCCGCSYTHGLLLSAQGN